ncbi:BZ3500_MvSof-1268-A1-R1_Chr2-1g04656 [Microbotryum saponariae]|uniref:BZ3500_MvSof-1268-A1-R1_Chr2-1g04656 protein n=1 Tax=Microbotryum saponariae TaxID=289078 RepID=A0A2X0K9G1_9BASI|nr:BZ3500_MvSof-1268-A1-R1_Chr2-1g04656 [Microbotryum saponariae]SCZ92231.1 BZ3501_MvSof-1269-A2-R1_Chr2-1g04312 [Microbotryum saponariae]
MASGPIKLKIVVVGRTPSRVTQGGRADLVEYLPYYTLDKVHTAPQKKERIGDGGVGKSSLVLALLKREFSEDYDPTVEDCYTTQLTVDGQEYSIDIVDTAGQEEYRGAWEEATAREGDGYSIDSHSSFEQLPTFLHIIRRVKSPHDDPTNEDTPENTPFPFLILGKWYFSLNSTVNRSLTVAPNGDSSPGNKCDKPSKERVVSAQTAMAYARSAGGLFTECSAKMSVNVDSAFQSIVRSTARAKLAREEWLRTHRGDDRNFSGNVAMMERPAVRVEVSDEKRPPRKKNPNLGLDRNASMSYGAGLAEGNDKKGGCGCGCVVM